MDNKLRLIDGEAVLNFKSNEQMYKDLIKKKKKIAVIGLGYVGLPLALEFAKKFAVIGFDINVERVELMRQGIDPSKELEAIAFENTDIQFTTNAEDLKDAHFFIVTVPTDIDAYQVPNLTPLMKASETVGKVIKQGDYVVYESTVYPGCTEEDCVPIIEQYARQQTLVGANGAQLKNDDFKAGRDFKYAYSPERIVPGDKVRTLTTILKIVSACDDEALEEVAKIYGEIITAGLYKAESVKVAEAAKVIENTQRDINISLMNELSIIFDKMNIDTNAVIEAAGTKWNFHKYRPGLVGGHCISVDPFYLLYKAKQLGHDPQVIAAGRRVNEYIPHFIAKRLVQTLIEIGKNPGESSVLVKGITFKENVADIRNSKVVDLVRELKDFSMTVQIEDAYADPEEVEQIYGIRLLEDAKEKYDAIVLAVGHQEYLNLDFSYFQSISNGEVILFDVKGLYDPKQMSEARYWRL